MPVCLLETIILLLRIKQSCLLHTDQLEDKNETKRGWVPQKSPVWFEKKNKMMIGAKQITCLVCLLMTSASARSKFKAAVYEHTVIEPDIQVTHTRKAALTVMEDNLAVYRHQTAQAHLQGADIIVFPEDGLYGFTFTREQIKPFLETIPDPRVVTWSACDDPGKFKDTEVQRSLSCMAKKNSIYVVANMGDVQACDVNEDPQCPTDGQYQYNTAVAFAPNGALVARYHKVNLYYEDQFNRPEPESVYFDTPFGRVGLFICFDVLFENPAVTMVMRDNVTTIAFPTAWMDALPKLSAIGFHSSFARGLGVNFLTANLHIPDSRFQGSGIYGPRGMIDFYFTKNSTSPGKLIVGELDILTQRNPEGGVGAKPNINSLGTLSEGTNNCPDVATTSENSLALVRSHDNRDVFKSKLMGDMFTFKAILGDSGFISVYDHNVSCHLNFTKETTSRRSSNDLFALGARDGRRTKYGYYFQACIVVRCKDASNRSSCGRFTFESHTRFSQLDLRGNMTTHHVFPQLLLTPARRQLTLAPPDSWTYDSRCPSIHVTRTPPHPVLSAALIGRVYSRDCVVAPTSPGTPCAPSAASTVRHGIHVTALLLTAVCVAGVS